MNEAATAEPAQAVEPQRREAWWVRHYTFTGTAVGLVFIWFSMTPSLLPRGPLFQGLVSGLAGAIGYSIGVSRYGWCASCSPGTPAHRHHGGRGWR